MVGGVRMVPDGPMGQFLSCHISKNALYINIPEY